MIDTAGAAVAAPTPPEVPAAPAEQAEPDLPEKFDEWFREHRGYVYRYVRVRVPSRAAAEDVTSEVFLKALRALPRYDERRGSPRTWLMNIARNAATDYLRTLKRRGSFLVSLERMADVASEAPCPEERVLRQEQMTRLLNGVAKLRPSDQDLIALRFGAGLPSREIAGMLNIGSNAVSARVSRAVVRLRAAVGEPVRASGRAR